MRERLVFIGQNPENLSGSSSKFYNLDDVPGDLRHRVRATWGRIGTRGQSKVYDQHEAREKLREKLGKGYVHAGDDLGQAGNDSLQTQFFSLSLVERARGHQNYQPVGWERLVRHMGQGSWVELSEISLEVEGRGKVKLYLDERSMVHAVHRTPTGFAIAWLGPSS